MQARIHRATLGLMMAGAVFGAAGVRAAEAPPHVYVTGEVAWNRTSSLAGGIDGALASQGITSTSSAERSSTNPGLRLGYAFNRNFAVEASYDRLGNNSVQSAITSPGADTASGSWHARGLGLHAVATAPLDNNWSVYGRAGVEHWRTSVDLASTAAGPTAVNNTGHNTALAFGLGTSYALAKNVEAVGEYTHFAHVGDGSTGAAGVNQFSAGLRYHFN